MHRILLAIAAFFMASPALAQTEQDIDWCSSNSATHDETIAGCTALIDGGRFDAADTSVAYSNRGIAYIAQGRFDQALADLSQAVALDPANYAAYYPRADLYTAAGSPDAAIADLTAYFSRGGRLAGAYKSRADLYYEKGNSAPALDDYTTFLAQQPGDLDALFRRGNLFYDAGRYADALADYSSYIALDSSADMVLAYRGDANWKLNRNAQAIADYRASLALFPDNQVAIDGLARLSAARAAAATTRPSSVVTPAPPPLTSGGVFGREQPAPPSLASADESQCVTMMAIPGSANGFWRVTNACGYAVSGYYCYQNATQMRCADTTPHAFGPVPGGGTTDVAGPGEQTSGRPGEIAYRVSFCPHDEYIDGACIIPRLN